MKNHGLPGKLALLGMGGCLLLVILDTTFVRPPSVRAQSQDTASDWEKAAGGKMSFDVASVKVPPDQNHFEASPEQSPGRFRWTAQGWNFVMYGYRMQSWQISGKTGLLASIYEIDATTDPHATDDQEREMVQSLLVDRFKLVAHRSTKIGDGYKLSVANGAPKLEAAKDGEEPPADMSAYCTHASPDGWVSATVPNHGADRGVTEITGCNATLAQLTDELDRVLQTVVVDQTNLSGKYYFDFKYASDPDPVVPAPSLTAAVSDLGLHLAKYKGSIESLVIDHIEEPTPN
jgi:uncharacterized protein (TIGR03435 family)